jgi:hypothetical protein
MASKLVRARLPFYRRQFRKLQNPSKSISKIAFAAVRDGGRDAAATQSFHGDWS